MSKKRKWMVIMIVAIFFVAFDYGGTQIGDNISSVNTAKNPLTEINIAPFVSAEERPIGAPQHLNIPDIGVNTNIIPIGVTKEGNLDVPNNYVDSGWYRYGPKPGEKGIAVIDGHVDNGGLIGGVFKKLRNLEIGDEIYINDEYGRKLTFKVNDINVYKTDEFPSQEIFFGKGSEDKTIKIITCHGKFMKARDTYDERLVVTAILSE